MKEIVEQAFKERVEPISDKLKEEQIKLKSLFNKLGNNQTEIKRVDDHFTDVCKALLRMNGIQIRDLNSHSIYKEFNAISKASELKAKMKR